MTYLHKPDRGSMFRNEDKVKPEQPDYKGKYSMPDGTIRKIAAWHTKTRNDVEYFSISFSDIPDDTAV